ncbi:MAG TPA: DUF4124 domain-containing protein [Burkholderiales bacterium]|nr:DUF4124 domain-containing protein [Burkholderiales bacterium]
MAMRLLKFTLGACALAIASAASAQSTVWRCVGPDGRPQYTNVKADAQGRNCNVVNKEVSVVPAYKQPPSTAKNDPSYPNVDRETQRARDDGRRKILEEELSEEQQKLSDAKAKLQEEESVRLGNEKNYQRVLDRLQPHKEAVAEHEKNVEALKKELGNIK